MGNPILFQMNTASMLRNEVQTNYKQKTKHTHISLNWLCCSGEYRYIVSKLSGVYRVNNNKTIRINTIPPQNHDGFLTRHMRHSPRLAPDRYQLAPGRSETGKT